MFFIPRCMQILRETLAKTSSCWWNYYYFMETVAEDDRYQHKVINYIRYHQGGCWCLKGNSRLWVMPPWDRWAVIPNLNRRLKHDQGKIGLMLFVLFGWCRNLSRVSLDEYIAMITRCPFIHCLSITSSFISFNSSDKGDSLVTS